MRQLAVVVLALCLGGCSVKEKLGDYGRDAIVEAVERSIDSKLEARGLSITMIKGAIDQNGDGKITTKEALATAKDAALIEAKRLVDDKIKDLESRAITKDEFGREENSMWNRIIAGVLGLLSAYLGKQVVSARNDAKKHGSHTERLATIEALLHGKKPEEPTEAENDA